MNRKYKLYSVYTLEFLLIAAAVLYVFDSFSLIYNGDGFCQLYTTMVYCGKYIRAVLQSILQGNLCIPQFDFAIGLGEEIIPTLNYYGFGDPFMLISALFPAKYSVYAYTAVILLKMYVGGISFIFYCRRRNYKGRYILAAVPVYVISAYVLYFGFQLPSYLNVLISLPLVCAGIDSIIRDKAEGKRCGYINVELVLGVAFQAVGGFYFLYMELLFAVVYALVSILCRVKSITLMMKKIAVLFGHVVLGISLGAVIFFPSVYGYVVSSRGGSFEWPGFWKVMGAGAEGYWSLFSQVIVPVKYSGMGLTLPAIAVLAIILAVKKEKEAKELKVLLIIFLLAYLNTHFTSWIAGGFSKAIYNNRWYFGLMFLLAVFVCAGGSLVEQITTRQMWIFAGISIFYIGCVVILERVFFQDSKSDRRLLIYLVYSIIILAVPIISAVIGKIDGKKIVWKNSYLLIGSIFIGSILNVYTIFGGTDEFGYGRKWYFKPYDSVRNEILASNTQLYSVEDGFGRMDIDGNILNESLYTGQFGTGEYLSILNGNLYDFFKNYMLVSEMKGTYHYLTGLDSRSGMEDMLSVVWYDDIETASVAENEDYLPIGFTFDSYVLQEDAEEMDAMTKNASLLEKVILDKTVQGIEASKPMLDNEKLLDEEAFEVEYINVENEGNTLKVTKDSKLRITIKDGEAGEYYLYADRFQLIEGKGEWYWVPVQFGNKNCEFVSEKNPYSNGIQDGLFCMGNMNAENNEFEITFTEEAVFNIENIHVYRIDTEELAGLNAKRQEETLQNVSIEGNKVQGSIQTEGKKILFLGIPYSTGWKAYVNGEEAEILKADYGFMAIGLEGGESEVILRYSTPGIKVGLVFSLTALGVLLLTVFFGRRKKVMNLEAL